MRQAAGSTAKTLASSRAPRISPAKPSTDNWSSLDDDGESLLIVKDTATALPGKRGKRFAM